MRLLRLLLIVPGLAFLLAMCVFGLVWSGSATFLMAVIGGNPFATNPSDELRIFVQNFPEGNGRVDGRLVAQAAAKLAQAPLEDEPFTLAAVENYRNQRYTEAEQLIDIARLRNPRSREARLVSVDVKMAIGKIDSAVSDLEVLFDLMPSRQPILEETLVLLSRHPETRTATIQAVKGHRAKTMVLGGLARSGSSVTEFLHALEIMGSAHEISRDGTAVASIVQEYMKRGDYGGAYQIWSKLALGTVQPPDPIRDRQFRQPLPPPFGWELLSNGDGYAATGVEGVSGEAYGRRRARLVRQLLILAPGRYRLTVNVSEASEQFEIAVACFSAQEIFVSRLARKGRQSLTFDVPANCLAQWITIDARASDPPHVARFRLESIALERELP